MANIRFYHNYEVLKNVALLLIIKRFPTEVSGRIQIVYEVLLKKLF